MEAITMFAAYLFDFFILYIFLRKTMGKRHSNIPSVIFAGNFLLVELLIFITGTLTDGLSENLAFYCNVSISILTTVCLCFLFQSGLKQKLYISLLFQTFVLLSENIAILLINQCNPFLLTNSTVSKQMQMAICNLTSKCVLFILCLLFLSFWNKKTDCSSHEYQIIVFATPLFSLIVLLSVPYFFIPNPGHFSFFYILFICLIILNVINYIMLNKIILSTEFKNQYQQMEQQILFQKEKYKQLNAAYRETRSIVHDVKKHYFAIQKLIHHQEYEQLLGYTSSAINTLECTYANINTGNLVIDSFVSNYQNMALQENIHFETVIQIDPNKIPLSDYDLCAILGNMMDNCLNACIKNTSANNHIHLQITMDKQDSLLIHTANSYQNVPPAVTGIEHNKELYHGFGLKNIERIAGTYHGMCYIKAEQEFQVYVVIPIIR